MKTGFIGAGKVGFSLGKFFIGGGIQVTGYWSRHIESASEAAGFTGTNCYETPEALIQDSDAIFITVPDGAIASVFEELKKYNLKGKQICHCSGSMTAREAFPGIGEMGASGYSIHPLFPVSNKYESYRELPDAFFCLEGDALHLKDWQERLESMGVKTKIIAPENKVKYHAACAISSNLMCALVQESLDLLTQCGFEEGTALHALAPLMLANIRHIAEAGPEAALTGPVERNDVETIRKHLACLDTEKERELYQSASRMLIPIAEQRHPESDFTEMKQLL